MPNLKDLKNRIESVKSTRKITKAMQMVAAAKLRKAQEAAEQARPYADKMSLVMNKITSSDNVSSSSPLLTGNGNNNIHLIIIATSERGLCGAFNSSIVRLAKNHINKLKSEGFQFKILTIGKKGREQLKREFGENMIDHVDLSEVKKIAYENASTISDNIISMFLNNEFDVATIFYNQFESVISQVPQASQLIPIEINSEKTQNDNSISNFVSDLDEQEIIEDLLPKAIATKIFTALLENGASEQGARMSAMDNATRNAGDMIDKLTIQFNRSRQAAITNELIEIISGAEAL